MVAQNTTLAEVYFTDDDIETIDTQVEAVTTWRERLHPRGRKWNGKSARKNPKSADDTVDADTIQQLESIASKNSNVDLDTMQPAKTHIFEDINTDLDVKQPAKTNTLEVNGSNIIKEEINTLEPFVEANKSINTNDKKIVTKKEPRKTNSKLELDQDKPGSKLHPKRNEEV